MGNPFEENTTAWLSTTGSQIFFMQLGFLAYEVGFCKPVWTQSLILKNVEDTFVGVLIYLCFGYTLSESPNTFHGIISVPTQPFLIGVSSNLHDQILISAFFASTCATIISGAVLERMKNKAYVVWCLLIILINYSFVAHWVWHEHGWLHQLGFVDGAGAIVVHSTAGMASLIAVKGLGVRKESIGENGKLLPVETASRPIINAMGAFFLWYGWFAFNVSSPIAFSKGIGDAIGTTAVVTVISPICAACSSFVMMHYFDVIPLSFENLLNCLLAGLVSITGPCHTCNIWEAAFIGFVATLVYFVITYIIRNKWGIDDPLQVITIHLFCGIYSCIMEGVVANDVYGTPGLIHGGFKHFGVQLLGVIVICLFNYILSMFLWDIVMKSILFRHRDIRVSILDIYLGTRLFDQNYGMALEEVLKCQSNSGKKMLYQFHKYVVDRFASEQLNFLIVIKIFGTYLQIDNVKKEPVKIAKYIIKIIDTYIDEGGVQCINISHTQRSILLKYKNQLLLELKEAADAKHDAELIHHTVDFAAEREEEEKKEDANDDNTAYRSHSLINYKFGYFQSSMDITRENIFNEAYIEIKRIVTPLFTQFLRYQFKKNKDNKFAVKIPFQLRDDWMLEWDQQIMKETDLIKLTDTIPQYRESGSLLAKTPTKSIPITNITHHITHHSEVSMQQIQQIQGGNEKNKQYPVIFGNDKNKNNGHDKNKIAVIID